MRGLNSRRTHGVTSKLVRESVPPTEGEVDGTATVQRVVIGR
jgi:hypothetical protein